MFGQGTEEPLDGVPEKKFVSDLGPSASSEGRFSGSIGNAVPHQSGYAGRMSNDHVFCVLYKLHSFRTIQNNRSDFLMRRFFGRSRLASRMFAHRLRHVIERDGNGHNKQGQKEKKK